MSDNTGTPAAPQPTPDEIIQALRQQNADLTSRLELKEEASRIEQAIKDGKKVQSSPIKSVADEIAKNKVISEIGLARYTQLSVEEKLKIHKAPPPTGADLADCKKCFGPGSSAIEANNLARRSPDRYRYLRLLAKALGILG